MNKEVVKGIKLIVSGFLDIVGMGLTYSCPIVCELADPVFGIVQGAWIYWAYHTPSLALLGVVEESIPYATDWIPSCLISHFLTNAGTKEFNLKNLKLPFKK